MEKDYILVLDSGVGGVSILKNLIKKLPNESFIYFLDNKSSPYGNKSKKFLQQNIIKILSEIFSKYKIKLVVFACNTITATTIKKVRKTFKNIKFVGTEPPVKLVKNNQKTLVLCTEQTLKHCKILEKFKSNPNFTFVALKNVAKLLDENFFNRKAILQSLLLQIKPENYKNVVLGCTHYYFLEHEIKQVLNNDNLNFYKSITGVTNRVSSLINTNAFTLQEIKVILSQKDLVLENTVNFLLKY